MPEVKTKEGFDPKADYIISIERGKKTFTHTVSQLTLDNIKALETNFPEEITSSNLNGEQRLKNPKSQNKRLIFLWEKIIKKVSGYSFQDEKKWKEKTPIMDKLIVATEITKVKSISESEIPDFFGNDQIVDCTDDQIVIYTVANQVGITLLQSHVFRQPDENQFEIYENTTTPIPIPKKNKVILKSKPSATIFCELYDNLIIDTKGYTITGKDNIPALHKTNAIRALFEYMNSNIIEAKGN